MSNPHPTPKFKKGNTAALGNDKTMRISTWIDKVLDEDMGDLAERLSLQGYERTMKKKEAAARKIVDRMLSSEDNGEFKALFQEVVDRTEGRPQQKIDHTTAGRPFVGMTDEQLEELLR